MLLRRMSMLAVVAAATLIISSCGVPKSEHEKVVKELQQVTDQLDQARKQNDQDQQKLTQLQGQVDALKKENDDLKAKAAKKPAAKSTAKKK